MNGDDDDLDDVKDGDPPVEAVESATVGCIEMLRRKADQWYHGMWDSVEERRKKLEENNED